MAKIVVAGALAAKPGNGGEAWVRVSWVLGLRRLGHDAWLLEQADAAGADRGRAFFERVTRRHGLGSRAVLLTPEDAAERAAAEELAAEADLLVDISGNLRDADLVARFERRAYVDLDPGFTQIWHAEGLLGDQLERYDRHFTVGLNVGAEDCSVPSGGIEWIGVPPPVLLDEWRPGDRRAFDRFTTVATWRNALGTPRLDDRDLPLKHHEFRRLADLPRRTGLPFEIALDIDPADEADREDLRRRGWSLADPRAVAADTDSFRAYVSGSGAEFSVAQGVYAESRSGWIGDRTAHYLAAGRPAVVQETGIPEPHRPAAGMLTFSDLNGAVAATERVVGSYEEHAAAARRFAERTFDSDRVLSRVLGAMGVG